MLASIRSSLIRGVRYSHTAAINNTIPAPRGKFTISWIFNSNYNNLCLILGQIQDVPTFLKAIGRGCDEVAGKFEVIYQYVINTDLLIF